jgi:putative membrane protein
MIKIIKYTSVVALSLALSATSFAAEKDDETSPERSSKESSGKVSAHDKAWAQMTAMSDMAEIQLSKAAQEKATSEQLKQHAAKMVQDHQQTSEELKAWAKEADVDLKAEMPAAKKQMLQEITSKSGQEFDDAYTQHEIAAHRMAVAHFQNGSEFLKNQELQAFAQKTLPIIQGHLSDVDKGGRQTTSTRPAPANQPATTASGATRSGDTPNAATTGQPGQGSRATGTQQPAQSGQVKTE